MQSNLLLKNDENTFLDDRYSVASTTASKKAFAIKQVKRFLTGIALTATVISATPVSAGVNLLNKADFDSGNFSGWRGPANKGKDYGTAQLVSSPVRAGSKAIKFNVTRGFTDGSKRRRSQFREPINAKYGTDYWYGWSMYIPNDWVFDNSVQTVLWQWHLNNAAIPFNAPDRPSNIGVPLLFITKGTTLSLKVNHPTGQKTLYTTSYSGMKGKWTDFVAHVVWSPSGDGVVESWINGQKIANYRGPTSYKDPTGAPYCMIGIYKPEWKNRPGDTNNVTLYFDEVRIGGPSASYKDVAPHGVLSTIATKPSVNQKTTLTKEPPVGKPVISVTKNTTSKKKTTSTVKKKTDKPNAAARKKANKAAATAKKKANKAAATARKKAKKAKRAKRAKRA